MHADRIIVRLTAVGLVATMFGCSRATAERVSSSTNASQALPSPTVKSLGNTPVASADRAAKVQVFQRQAGIGAALRIVDGKVFVTKVLPDTPAARSNMIKGNDQIVAVAEGDAEPINVTGTTDVARVVGMIRGPVRTVVRLTIIPQGLDASDQVVVSVVRGDIKEIDLFIDGRLLPVGSKAPNFKFTRLGKAEEVDLFQLAGRIVVVEFWASWCGSCIKSVDELAALQAQHPEWAGQVELLAVGVDERKEDAVTVFNGKQWSKNSTAWSGPDVLKLYRVAGLPTIFVMDRNGVVRAVDHRLDLAEVIGPLLLPSKEKTGSR